MKIRIIPLFFIAFIFLHGCSFNAEHSKNNNKAEKIESQITENNEPTSQGYWTSLGEDYYRPMYNGQSIVYTSLQPEEMRKISDAVTINSRLVEKWQGKRPEIIMPLEIKKISAKNNLKDVIKTPFEVTFEEFSENKTAELIEISSDGETILTPADPEYSPLLGRLIMSPDKQKYLIPTDSGLWLLENDTKQATKISKDTYKGQNRAQLTEKLKSLYPELDGPFIIWWNEHPIFSPDSSKIAFTTNRDFQTANGMSLWVYDFASNEERPIVSTIDGEHYLIKGWVGTEHLIVERHMDLLINYYIVDMMGNLIELNFEGENPILIATHSNGYLLHSPDAPHENIYVSKTGLDKQTVSNIAQIALDGQIISNSVTFNPSGTKVAYISSATDSRFRLLNIFDFNLGKEIEIDQKHLNGDFVGGQAAFWISDNQLLVNAEKRENNMIKVSTWIYSMDLEK